MAQYDDRARYKGTPYYDQGGVHYNSGIINRIGYTIIQNLGIEKAQTIFYSSLVNYLTPKAQFSDARDAMLAAAKFNMAMKQLQWYQQPLTLLESELKRTFR